MIINIKEKLLLFFKATFSYFKVYGCSTIFCDFLCFFMTQDIGRLRFFVLGNLFQWPAFSQQFSGAQRNHFYFKSSFFLFLEAPGALLLNKLSFTLPYFSSSVSCMIAFAFLFPETALIFVPQGHFFIGSSF